MSDQRTRIDALLNHGDGVPDAAVYVDGRLLRPDSTGSTAFDLTPAGVSATVLPARSGVPSGTTLPARSGGLPEAGTHVRPGTGQHAGQQHAGSQAAPALPAENIKGLGKHGAQVDVTDPGGKQHVPYTVHKNKDGSLDVNVPAGPGHPHATRIHVAPGKHVQLNLSQDKNGHVKVHAQPATGSAPPTKPAAPHLPAGPKAPKVSTPPGGGGAPPGGGGGGAPPGGGGLPTPQAAAPAPAPASGDNQTKNADQTAMEGLGDKIDMGPGSKMASASSDTGKIQVGFPGFGVLGAPLGWTHSSVQQDAVRYLSDGHTQLGKWSDQLHGMAATWNGAEGSSTLPPV